MNNRSTDMDSGSGVGFVGLLQVLFIGLKLTDVIDWSWWWVMSPILGSIALWIIVLGLILTMTGRK